MSPPQDDGHRALVDTIVGLLGSAAPPSWRPLRPVGLRAGDSFVRPDVAVLRPGAPPAADWVDPSDVALVVEVETPHSRRVDRCLKPGLYADAGVESYWRIERTGHGPVAHLYTPGRRGPLRPAPLGRPGPRGDGRAPVCRSAGPRRLVSG